MQIIPRPEWSVSQEHLAHFPTAPFSLRPSSELVMTEACFLNNRCQEEEAGCVSGGWLLHVDDDDVSGFLLHAAASLLPRKLSPGEAE